MRQADIHAGFDRGNVGRDTRVDDAARKRSLDRRAICQRPLHIARDRHVLNVGITRIIISIAHEADADIAADGIAKLEVRSDTHNIALIIAIERVEDVRGIEIGFQTAGLGIGGPVGTHGIGQAKPPVHFITVAQILILEQIIRKLGIIVIEREQIQIGIDQPAMSLVLKSETAATARILIRLKRTGNGREGDAVLGNVLCQDLTDHLRGIAEIQPPVQAEPHIGETLRREVRILYMVDLQDAAQGMPRPVGRDVECRFEAERGCPLFGQVSREHVRAPVGAEIGARLDDEDPDRERHRIDIGVRALVCRNEAPAIEGARLGLRRSRHRQDHSARSAKGCKARLLGFHSEYVHSRYCSCDNDPASVLGTA